ncbi:MAG TPA: hypothetical protein VGQ26_23060 [Streptosporangiaceae bacterium]|nr:hypothetical protein [Streptosporangiaceae bacterium]
MRRFGARLAVLRGKGLSWRSRLGRGPAAVWLSVFGASLILFMVRLMLPAPVGQADNHDGPRLRCWLGLHRHRDQRPQRARRAGRARAARELGEVRRARLLGQHLGRHDPLFSRYAGQLTDVNIAQFLLTHPGSILGVGQHAAILAQHFRVTTLGNCPPSAGQPPGASETRVVALTWLMHLLPPGWGLWWLIPLWAAMVAVGVGSLRRRRDTGWQRDGGILVLSMTACAVAAFIPPAYFAGISTTRHMVGMNVATALAFSSASRWPSR